MILIGALWCDVVSESRIPRRRIDARLNLKDSFNDSSTVVASFMCN